MESVTPGGDYDDRYISVILPNGVSGVFTIPAKLPQVRAGDEILVKIFGAQEGRVSIGLSEAPKGHSSSGCLLLSLLPLLIVLIIGIVAS